MSFLQDSYIVSGYMKKKFPYVLLGNVERPDEDIHHPLDWSLDFALEVDLALDVMARAFHNQGIFFQYISRIYLTKQISIHKLGCEAICRSYRNEIYRLRF
jgi:hypothetical protein